MKVLRGLLIIEFLACLLLYCARVFGWQTVDESPVLDWVFLFAYPMAVLGIVLALILLVFDLVRFRSRTMGIAVGWIGFDVVLPILNFLVFWAYYEQIGQM